jgi:hypothetical protein
MGRLLSRAEIDALLSVEPESARTRRQARESGPVVRISVEAVRRAFTDALAAVCATRANETAVLVPALAPDGPGWLATVPVSGAARGYLLAWFERNSTAAFARMLWKAPAAPNEDAVLHLLREIVCEAVAAIETTPAAAGMMSGDVQVALAAAPSESTAQTIAMPGGRSCHVVIGAELTVASADRSQF